MPAHMSDNQLFSRSCTNAATFPKNIVRSTTSKHNLESFFNRLEEHNDRLFCGDGKASIELWEYLDTVQGMLPRDIGTARRGTNGSAEFRSKLFKSADELESHLGGEQLFLQEGPRSRFV